MAETGKKRSVRIPLDYYKKPDLLATWRLALSAVALLIAAGWASGLSWDFWSASRRAERVGSLASHGPLAQAHATWDSQCDACHIPFRPMVQATWAVPFLGDSSKTNLQCQGCHSAPIHHASQKPQDLACARCHHDHQGRDASLLRMADQHCTQCHADLRAHLIREDQEPSVDDTITRFDANPAHHPPFRSTKNDDPGRLKFDHARHLTAGMAGDKGGPVQSLKMLSKPDQERYKKYAQGADGAIRLDCAACHQIEPGASADSRSDGPYMLPVTYQNHCRACHSLDYDPAASALVMAHPLQPAEVSKSLWQTYAAGYLKEQPDLLDQPIEPRPMPGKPENPELLKARQAIERKVASAEKILFGAKKCGECHLYDPGDKVSITPTNVPAVWWRNAVFDHSAHRGVDCRSCHERAYRDSPHASHESKDVLLPTIQQCLECHAPRRQGSVAGTMTGGAGFGCTECHRYHNGDAALLGLTTASSAPETRSTIEQFLLGTPATTLPKAEGDKPR